RLLRARRTDCAKDNGNDGRNAHPALLRCDQAAPAAKVAPLRTLSHPDRACARPGAGSCGRGWRASSETRCKPGEGLALKWREDPSPASLAPKRSLSTL